MTCITSDDNYIYIGTNQGNVWRIDPTSNCLHDATILFVPSIQSYYIEKMEIIAPSSVISGNLNTNITGIAILAHSHSNAVVVTAKLPNIHSHSTTATTQHKCLNINDIMLHKENVNNISVIEIMDQLNMLQNMVS